MKRLQSFVILSVVTAVACALVGALDARCDDFLACVSGANRHAFEPGSTQLFGDGFWLDLGSCSSIQSRPHKFVIDELPPGHAIAIAFVRTSGKPDGWFEIASPGDALGVSQWTVELAVQDEECATSSRLEGSNGFCIIEDRDSEKEWLTAEGVAYALSVRGTGAKQDTDEKNDDGQIHLALIGIRRLAASTPDSRPQGTRVVDHGEFDHDDLSVNVFELKTPTGKYMLDLGEADIIGGTTHRYQIAGLPKRQVLTLGFALQSADPTVVAATDRSWKLQVTPPGRNGPTLEGELPAQTGIRRIHIHLATTDGHVLISEEFDVKTAFGGMACPLGGRPWLSDVNAYVAAKSEDTRPNPRVANDASGSSFVVEEGVNYVLDVTVIEVQDGSKKVKRLRPILIS